MTDNLNAANKFSKSYLNSCANNLKGLDANGDGKVSLEEFKEKLSIFDDKELNEQAKDLMSKFVDNDGCVTAEGYAQWLNSEEYGKILDKYKSSTTFSEIEMDMIENSQDSFKDGKITKGEVKVDLLNRLPDGVDGSKMEALIDKYAGKDGIFTVEEYTKLKNNPEFKAFLKEHNIYLGTDNKQRNNGSNTTTNFNNFNFNITDLNIGNFNINTFFNNFLSIFKLKL